MTVTKYERHEQEHTIFQARSEQGVQALRTWLYARREEINLKWPGAVGDDLLHLQGETLLVNRLIKMIDFGPTIPRQTEEVKHG